MSHVRCSSVGAVQHCSAWSLWITT